MAYDLKGFLWCTFSVSVMRASDFRMVFFFASRRSGGIMAFVARIFNIQYTQDHFSIWGFGGIRASTARLFGILAMGGVGSFGWVLHVEYGISSQKTNLGELQVSKFELHRYNVKFPCFL